MNNALIKIARYLPILFILSACHQTANKTEDTKPADTMAQYPDSLLLDKPGAVIVRPNMRQINARKNKYGSEVFGTVLNAGMLYMYESQHYLDSIQTYKIERETEGIMKFKTNKGEMYTMKLDTLFYDIILFNGKDRPVYADMGNMPDSYAGYMKK
jgi:hypothetical protein